MSGPWQTYGLQHTRLPCPSLPPEVCSFMSTELVMLSNCLNLCKQPSPFALSHSHHQGLCFLQSLEKLKLYMDLAIRTKILEKNIQKKFYHRVRYRFLKHRFIMHK